MDTSEILNLNKFKGETKPNVKQINKIKNESLENKEIKSIRNKLTSTNTNLRKKIIKESLIILLFIIDYMFYYWSLEPCLDGEPTCSRYQKWIFKKVRENVIFVILMTFFILLIINKKISRLHLIHIIVVLIIFYSKSHGTKFEDHGYMNFSLSLVAIILLLLILLPIIKVFLFIKQKKYKKLIKFISALVLLIVLPYFFLISPRMSCKDWDKGLNNTYIDNDIGKYGCSIKIPKICTRKLFYHFLDFTKILRLKCGKRYPDERDILKSFSLTDNINKNTVRIGYPTLTASECFGEGDCYSYTYHNLVDMDNKTQLNKLGENYIPELILDFSNNSYGDLKININYKEQLSKQRKSMESKTKPLYENVLVIYIDSLSRVNSLRQLKKTFNFLNKFFKYEGHKNSKFPSENYHSFEFFKYYAFEGYTSTNYPNMFAGESIYANQGRKLITKYFKENGYMTGIFVDCCKKTASEMPESKDETFDHIVSLCDPIVIKGCCPIIKDRNAYGADTPRCLYGRDTFQYMFEFGNKFWEKYKNNRKFLEIISNDSHEPTSEHIKYIDESLFNFIYKLFIENKLKDTFLTLVSDHGSSLPGIYNLNPGMYDCETHLPMLFFFINDRNNLTYEEQYQYLNENQQTFITGYDLFNTFAHIIYGDNYINIKNKAKTESSQKTNQGSSLFWKINQKNRSPKNYQNMNPSYCV